MLKKVILLSVLCSLLLPKLYGQQPSPINIIYSPRVNTFAISGVGGGNLYELNAEKSSTSGQIALDWNIGLNNRNVRGYRRRNITDKLRTLTTVFKYNPLVKSSYIASDTIELRKIAFTDNECQLMFGVRLNGLKLLGSDGNAKLLTSFFGDFTTTPYDMERSLFNNTGFRTFNLNIGGQIGWLTNTEFGLVGLILSPQINYINIYDNKIGDTSFEEMAKSNTNLSRNLLGLGGKLLVPLNDFSFFIDFRRYFPISNAHTIEDLSDRMIFSFGGVATGTVFKTKTKEEKATK